EVRRSGILRAERRDHGIDDVHRRAALAAGVALSVERAALPDRPCGAAVDRAVSTAVRAGRVVVARGAGVGAHLAPSAVVADALRKRDVEAQLSRRTEGRGDGRTASARTVPSDSAQPIREGAAGADGVSPAASEVRGSGLLEAERRDVRIERAGGRAADAAA